MKLPIKNKDNKANEYCFNKDFFITVLSMLDMYQHSQQLTTQCQKTKCEKTKLKKPNEKTKSKKT